VPADVAHANHDELLELVLAQNSMELLTEFIDFVSAATIPLIPNRKVLADLRRCHTGGVGQIVGEDSNEVQGPQPIQCVFVRIPYDTTSIRHDGHTLLHCEKCNIFGEVKLTERVDFV